MVGSPWERGYSEIRWIWKLGFYCGHGILDWKLCIFILSEPEIYSKSSEKRTLTALREQVKI